MTSAPLGDDAHLLRATQVADKLKAGTYDAVQALALVSIARSLSRIADSLENRSA